MHNYINKAVIAIGVRLKDVRLEKAKVRCEKA